MAKRTKYWDMESSRAELEGRQGTSALWVFDKLREQLDDEFPVQWSGSGHRVDDHATMWPWIEGNRFPPFCVRVDGSVEVPFKWINHPKNAPFDDEAKRIELRERLSEVSPEMKTAHPDGRPTFPLSLLGDEENLKHVIEVFKWYVSQLRLSRWFTHYWSNQTWNRHRTKTLRDTPLSHTAGNLFRQRGVRSGDFVYVVTVIDGQLYVGSRLEVAKVCDAEKAAHELGCEPEELWNARDHIVAASATPMRFGCNIPAKVTQSLRFMSGRRTYPLKFRSPGQLDAQTLRGLRELTPESAGVLNGFIDEETRVVWSDNSARPAEEVPDEGTYWEGAVKRIAVNVYERSAAARRACLDPYDTVACQICGFSFEESYGEIGAGFIHVHHVKPLSKIGDQYELDPAKDLVPVCPNCHAMIHRCNPPYSVEQMKQMLRKSQGKPVDKKSLED